METGIILYAEYLCKAQVTWSFHRKLKASPKLSAVIARTLTQGPQHGVVKKLPKVFVSSQWLLGVFVSSCPHLGICFSGLLAVFVLDLYLVRLVWLA